MARGGGVGFEAALAWWEGVDQAPAGELWLPPRAALLRGPDDRPAVGWWPWPAGAAGADPDTALRAWRRETPERGMLKAFLALADAESGPSAVLRFVQRCGPLGIVDGRPRPELVYPSAWLFARPDPGYAVPMTEPVAAYTALARRMGAVLRVLAVCAHGRGLGACREDLARLVKDTGVAALLPVDVSEYVATLDTAAARELALNHVGALLAQSRPALDLRLHPAPWERPATAAGAEAEAGVPWPTGVTLWPRGAFATLVVQLAAAVAALRQQALCDACGTLYTPRRRPRAGEAHYCPRCGLEGGYRAAKRRWWQTHRHRRPLGPGREQRERREQRGQG